MGNVKLRASGRVLVVTYIVCEPVTQTAGTELRTGRNGLCARDGVNGQRGQ